MTNLFVLGLNATATDDTVNKVNETKYTICRARYYCQAQITFATTHFSTLNLTDGGPRQGHRTLE
jgi:hypothetical protein